MPRTLHSLLISVAAALLLTASANVPTAALSLVGPLASSVAQERWEWPVESPHPVIRPFIAPATPYSPGHRGIDIGAARATEVRAPAAGIVHFSGTVVDRPVVSIRHPGGLISSIEPVSSTLSRGDAVETGQVIGTLEEGHCSVPCVHFGVRLDGEYVSPLNYLDAIPRAVLLPTRKP